METVALVGHWIFVGLIIGAALCYFVFLLWIGIGSYIAWLQYTPRKKSIPISLLVFLFVASGVLSAIHRA